MIDPIKAMRDPELFGPWFQGTSWLNWKAFIAGLFGLPMSSKRAARFRKYTGRESLPTTPAREAFVIVGRRGGKSLVASLIAVYLSCFYKYSEFLSPGERGTLMVIAADRRQARVVKGYISAFINNVPMLKAMLVNETKESIELSNRIVVEIHTASFRSTRGYTLVTVIADELAFWRSEESANPDVEILNAVRPGLSTIPNSLLLCISSPYARRGVLWDSYHRHYGKESNALVWQADTRSMNPKVDERIIAEAYEADSSAASAEYGAEFRSDLESFIDRETVMSCVVPKRTHLPYLEIMRYQGFVDVSGGRSESMALAISHAYNGMAILDLIYEWKAPFNPSTAVRECARMLREFHVSAVTGDRYAAQFTVDLFRQNGIAYRASDKTKSEIYSDFLPALNSGKVQLLDDERMINQLVSLERRTSRSGKDSIDHPPHGRDDRINAVAGALVNVRHQKFFQNFRTNDRQGIVGPFRGGTAPGSVIYTPLKIVPVD
jgi:hypothetical protein